MFEETWVRLNLDGIGNVDFQGDSFDTGGPLHVIHHPGNLLEKRHFMQIDRRLAALQFGDGEQIPYKQGQSVGMLLHLAQKVHQSFLLHLGMVHDGFDKSLDHRQGCPEFMADIGNEITPGIFKLLELGQVMKIEKDAARFAG